jgi:DNA gyrase subunit A
LVQLLEDIKPEERIATVLKVRDLQSEGFVFMATRQGVVKKTAITAFSNPRRKGIYAIEIDESDELIAAHLCHEGQQVMLFTRQGMAVRFLQDDVRPMGRTARGVKGVKLRAEGDCVVSCEIVNGTETVLIVCENGFGKRSSVEEFRKTNRGGVGVRSIVTSERNGEVSAGLVVNDADSVVMISSLGQTVRISMRDVRVMGRNTQGVRLVSLKDGTSLVAVQRLRGDDAASSEEEGVEAALLSEEEGSLPAEAPVEVSSELADESFDESQS